MNDESNDAEPKEAEPNRPIKRPAKRTAAKRTAKRPAKRLGRPPVLDAAKQRDLCALIAIGCSRETAAAYVGCSPRAIYDLAHREPTFAAQLLKADHTCEVHALSLLNKVGTDSRNWRVLTWMLERKFPERYGSRKPSTVSNEDLASVVDRFAALLAEELPAGEVRERVLERLSTALDCLHEDSKSGEGP